MPAQARLNLGSGPDCFTVELFTMKCKINGMAPVFAEIHGSPSTGIEEGWQKRAPLGLLNYSSG
jgi:hypothetical protein